MNNSSPIGIFDSGVGGLSVVSQISNVLPKEDLIYVADSKYSPYGNRSEKEIFIRSEKIINLLIKKYHVKVIVIACNTATAACIKELRDIFSIPIVGMEPAVKPANNLTKTKRVGILATTGTLKSSKFAALLSYYEGDTKFFSQPCQGLVEQIEKGLIDAPDTRAIVNQNLALLESKNIDVIILGCTHFVFIRHLIEDYFNQTIPIIDTGFAVAQQLVRQLEANNLSNIRESLGHFIFCTNDESDQPRKALARLMPDINFQLEIFN
jgi:glutamate racemase